MNKPLKTYLSFSRIYNTKNFKFDFIAAFMVFLVAIPLCLGIALASGAPMFSGILSGIIGGIIVGCLSGSAISVSGPTAGMSAIVIATMSQLGGDFNLFLLALLVAGILQIILGSLKAGFIADYIPSNVVQGLLCAIGLLLIIKQLPLAFTLSHSLSALKMQLLDVSEGFSLQPLRELSFHINSGAMLLSVTSLLLLVFFDKTQTSWLKAIPGTIIVMILGIALNEIFVLTDSYLAQNSPHLVRIPKHDGWLDFYHKMQCPTWSALSQPKVYIYALLIASVSSLENLLNIKAFEKLDKNHRHVSKDRELMAQGVGNVFAGLIGGIPITSGVVPTSVNIQTGAKTKMATILHGLFLLLAVMLLPGALNKIPLSSLAAILIYTGYKLTHPSIFITIYRQGVDRFVPFIATLLSILIFNILTGILIGLLVSLFYILKSNSKARLDIIQEIYPNGITNRLVLPQQTTFLNKASLIAELDSIPAKSQLIIDARYSDYIDKEIIELLKEFQSEEAPCRQISLNLIGFKQRYNIHNYIDFINVTTYDVQTQLPPWQVLAILIEGNQRFLNDTRIHRSLKIDIKHTASTQHPIAVVLGCIDSRVPVETIFDMSFGDLFCIRVAGNVVNDDILASIEYACHVVGAKLIVVLGHTRCGAICAACDGVQQGHITQLLDKIKPAIEAEHSTTINRNGKNDRFVQNVTKLNIANTLQHIYQESDVLRTLINNEEIGIVGAMYDVSNGYVHFQDFSTSVTCIDSNNDHLAKKLHKLINPDILKT